MRFTPSCKHTGYSFLLGVLSLALFHHPGLAGESIQGFRDLNFGMTEQEVAALDMCSSASSCMYELTNKNRYLTMTYLPEASPTPKLAKITIDMGQYTDAWHQQLQGILSNSYRPTQPFTEEHLQGFLQKQRDQLHVGYDDGQVVLTVVRRPFGNLVLKVVYQNPTLAKEFLQKMQGPAPSTP